MPRYCTEFDGYSLFPVRLTLISSESTFLGELKIVSSAFSALSETLLALNQLFNCFISWLTSLFRFSLAYLYERDLYHQQSDVLCSIEMLYEDH